jgi:hypothetical protein
MSVTPSYVYVFDPKVDKLPPCPEVKRENIIIKKHRGPLFESFGNIFWHITSGFSFYRWSILDQTTGEELAYSHTSYRLWHFLFIKQLCKEGNGYFVGPDATIPPERKKGLHPYLLWTILSSLQKEGRPLYGRVAMHNTASIKGLEKAGFRRVGYMKRIGLTYRLCDEQGRLL